MSPETKPAAQYIRMSTDRQDLSPLMQKEALAAFALEHRFEIVRTFEDEGKSGVRITNRPGLRALLQSVQESPSFDAVLVYDVSRWGRFQDVDAGAYYEYHCRLNGVEVIYVAEQFGRDATPMAMLAKSMKRVMAAEYSRELAAKSRAGQLRIVSMGYQMGPLPPFGYRRESVSSDGQRRILLAHGDLKRSLTDRIRWVLAPPEEVQLVQDICCAYATSRLDIPDIASIVGAAGWRSEKNRTVTPGTISRLITNEALIGNFVWGTGTTQRRVFQAIPTRLDGSVPRIVDDATWTAMQERLAHRSESTFFRRAGPSTVKVSTRASLDMLSDVIKKRYEVIGEHLRQTRSFGRALCVELNASGIPAGYESLSNVICLWGVLIRINLVWRNSAVEWAKQRPRRSRPVDFVLMARMLEPFRPKDFYLVPTKALEGPWPKDFGKLEKRLRRYRFVEPSGLTSRFAVIAKRAQSRLRKS